MMPPTNVNQPTLLFFVFKNINNFNHVYNYEDKILVVKRPPIPFITSSLQQKCSSECKIKPKVCMMICQKLYEKGYITYMRTDAAKYSDEFLDKSKKFIVKNFGKEYINKNIDNLKVFHHKPHTTYR